jgi:hypothetical protein
MNAIVTALEAARAAAASDTGEMHMVSCASVRYHGPECDSPCYWAPCWGVLMRARLASLFSRVHMSHMTLECILVVSGNVHGMHMLYICMGLSQALNLCRVLSV